MDSFVTLGQSPVFFWLIAGLSVFFLSVAKSGFGGALATTSVPVMLLAMSPVEALAVLLPIFVVSSVGVLFLWRKFCNWRLVSLMCLFAFAGQILGWLLFDFFTAQILRICIGGVAVATALDYGLRLLGIRGQTHPREWAEKYLWPRAGFWCGLSGISSFVSLSGGVPAQIFLLPHRLSKEAFVGTFSVYFVAIDLLKAPLYTELDILTLQSLSISAMLLPIIPVGVGVGWWLNKRINETIFYHISYGFLLAIGIKLLTDAYLAWSIAPITP